MEKISFDAALHLPTIDPAPPRQPAGRGGSPDRFDDHLQRASSPPENSGRSRPSNDAKHAANKPPEAPQQSASASTAESSDDDAHHDDNGCGATGMENSSGVGNTDKTTQSEGSHNDDATPADASGGGEAAAAASVAAATAQNAAQQVVTQSAQTNSAVAQPEKIGALQDAGEQSGDAPAKMPESGDESGFSTVDTPDITARKVTESVAVKSGELHEAAATQAKSTLPLTKPESAAERVTTASASSEKSPGETVAPVDGEAENGDKKRHVGKARLTASEDAKLDATAATEAKAALPATTSGESDGSLQNSVAPDTSLPTTGTQASDGQSTNPGASASSPVVDAAGKHNPAAQAPAAAPASAAQKILEGSPRAATSGGGDNTSEVERARFVQRVSKAFQTASQRGEPLRLRLSPPELGSVRMEVSIRSGAMTAKLQAETPAAQSMLLDNLPALRERLAQHNIKIERFDVDLFGQQNEGSQQSPSDAFDRQASRTLPLTSARLKSSVPTEEKPTPIAGRRSAGSGQLNVII